MQPDPLEPITPITRALVRSVEAAQAELGGRADALGRAAGLACPPACGACCLSPEVATSVVEMLPVAAALFARGEALAVHARLAAAAAHARALGEAEGGPCVLYAPEPKDPRRGRCSAYAERPSVCRVFGFAARRAGGSAEELATCRELRKSAPEAVERAAALVASGFDAPRIDRGPRAIALAHGDAAAVRPINQALRLALERVGLERRLADDDDGRRPPRNAA